MDNGYSVAENKNSCTKKARKLKNRKYKILQLKKCDMRASQIWLAND